MNRAHSAIFAVLLPLCGCGDGAPLRSATAAPSEAIRESTTLTIEAARLRIGAVTFEVTAAGVVVAGAPPLGEPFGDLDTDGTFVDARGRKVSVISANGEVSFAKEDEKLRIGEDGTVVRGDRVLLRIGADGVASGPLVDELGKPVRYEGPPAGRRAVVFAYLSAEAPDQPP